MGTEFEELRLSITLIDDSSAGFRAVREELRGATGSAADYQKLLRDNTKSAAIYKDVVGHVDGRLVLLGGAVGFLSSKLDRIGSSLASTVPTLTAFAKQQQQANQLSQLLGMSIGQLKNMRSQAASSGVSQEDADKTAAGLVDLRNKLSSVGGRTRFQEMLHESGFSLNFRAHTELLAAAKDDTELFNLIQEGRRNIERYAIEKEGMDPELAREMGHKWLMLHGLPPTAVAMETLKQATKEYLAEQQRQVDVAEKWLAQTVELARHVRNIKGQILMALGPGTKFYEEVQKIVKITDWLATNAELWFWATMFSALGTPGGFAAFLRQMQKEGFGKLWDLLRKKLSNEMEELTFGIQKINLVMSSTTPGIVPASFEGTGGLPSWLQTPGGAVTPGGAPPGAPTPGTGASTGGGGGPRSPGGGEGAPKTPGVDTGGTPGTPSGPPAIDPKKPLPPGVLYNPITSNKFIGGVGGRSASRGAGGHQGEDWGAPIGTPVYAVRDGVISRVGTDNFGQPAVTIDHGDGTFTRDLHLQPGSVPPVGTKVYGGQPYARSGTANGVPHLHHERWFGQPGRSGSRLISPMEESGRKAKEGMVGGELAPRSAQPGDARKAAPETPALPPAPEPSAPVEDQTEKPAWPRTLPTHPDKTPAPEGGFSPIPPGGLPRLSTPEVPIAPTGDVSKVNKLMDYLKFDRNDPGVKEALANTQQRPGESDASWMARSIGAVRAARDAGRVGTSLQSSASTMPAGTETGPTVTGPTVRPLPNLGDGRFRSGARGPIKLSRPGEESADEAITRRIQEMKDESGLSARAPPGSPAREIQRRFPDRSEIDRASGNELRATVNGGAKAAVDVSTSKKSGGSSDSPLKPITVERQSAEMESAERGPSVEVD